MSLGDNLYGNNTEKTDPKADAAEKALNKAISLSKETSETWVVKKMIISLRMLGDVMNRAMTAMPEATAALDNAKKLDANNPRIYILEGQDKYYTLNNTVVVRTKQKFFLKKHKNFLNIQSQRLLFILIGEKIK
jgi:hypothetical protein